MRSIIFTKKEAMKIIKPIVIPTTGAYSRASVAYYTNSNNILTLAAVNEPRFSYKSSNMSQGAALLVENASTNLCGYSNSLNESSVWIKLSCSTTQGFLAPDNTNSAWKVTANSSTGEFKGALNFIVDNPPAGIPTTYTNSVYLKAGNINWVELNTHGGNDGAFFNIATGTIGKVFPGVTAKIEAAPNGFWRCSVTRTLTDEYVSIVALLHTADEQGSWTSTGTEFIYAWGHQTEISPNMTSYIAAPTASAATRAADIRTSSLISNVSENDFPLYSTATTYAVGDKVLDLTSHKVYSSVAAGNLNKPLTDTAFWLDNGFDNRWRMFDKSVNSQTTKTGQIAVGILPAGRFDSIVGLNISAASVMINVDDPVSGIVYNRLIQMTSYSGIQDWYAYFYEPVIRLTDFVVEDIPPVYSNSAVTVAFESSGTTAVGTLIIGLSKTLGISEWGTKVGMVDYSVKTIDSFGNYTIVPRNFSKRADFSIQVPTSQVDDVYSTLVSYRSIPIIYLGSNTGAKQQFNSAIIYGFYKDFSISISYPAYSVCTAQIEGLT